MKDYYKHARIDGTDRWYDGPDNHPNKASAYPYRGRARQRSKIDLRKEVEDFYTQEDTQEDIWNTCPQPDGTIHPNCKTCDNDNWRIDSLIDLLMLLKVWGNYDF